MKDRKQQSGGGAKGAVAAPPVATVEIVLPIKESGKSVYVQRHVDVQLDTLQSEALRLVLDGLQAEHARLANGRIVQHGADAARYICEQIDQAAAAARSGPSK